MAEEIVEWIAVVARDGRKFKVWNALCHYLSDPLSDDTRLMCYAGAPWICRACQERHGSEDYYDCTVLTINRGGRSIYGKLILSRELCLLCLSFCTECFRMDFIDFTTCVPVTGSMLRSSYIS